MIDWSLFVLVVSSTFPSRKTKLPTMSVRRITTLLELLTRISAICPLTFCVPTMSRSVGWKPELMDRSVTLTQTGWRPRRPRAPRRRLRLRNRSSLVSGVTSTGDSFGSVKALSSFFTRTRNICFILTIAFEIMYFVQFEHEIIRNSQICNVWQS